MDEHILTLVIAACGVMVQVLVSFRALVHEVYSDENAKLKKANENLQAKLDACESKFTA